MVFLEIGCGLEPVPHKGERDFHGTDQYIGVDKDPEALYGYFGAAYYASRENPGSNLEFLHYNGERLPLPADSVDEVSFCDVLGDPGIDLKLSNLGRFCKPATYARRSLSSLKLCRQTYRSRNTNAGACTNTTGFTGPSRFYNSAAGILPSRGVAKNSRPIQQKSIQWHSEFTGVLYYGDKAIRI